MKHKELLDEIWKTQDDAYDLMWEYDSLSHFYGDQPLYQAEANIIDLIALEPGITTTEVAATLRRTPSACSQIIKKLRDKGWVEQTRNVHNNRQYNLTLTESGERLYREHVAFTEKCQEYTFRMLEDFTPQELEAHIRVQKQLNKAYAEDIRRSKELSAKMEAK